MVYFFAYEYPWASALFVEKTVCPSIFELLLLSSKISWLVWIYLGSPFCSVDLCVYLSTKYHSVLITVSFIVNFKIGYAWFFPLSFSELFQLFYFCFFHIHFRINLSLLKIMLGFDRNFIKSRDCLGDVWHLKIKLIGVTLCWFITLCKFQAYNFVIRQVHTLLCSIDIFSCWISNPWNSVMGWIESS